MLEFVVPGQFESEAQKRLCTEVLAFPEGKERTQILEGILTDFKDGKAGVVMSSYSVKYKEDGTTEVIPFNMGFAGNEYTLQQYLEEEGQTIMLVREGKSVCIVPFSINDRVYLRTFDAEQAPSLREALTAELTEPKELSFYDKVCDFFATRILKRPGKAVQAYNDQKAFNEAMRKAADNLGGIPEKVEDYKQAPQRAKEEQERQLQMQKELERLTREKEEAERKAQEELKKQEEQRLKQLKAEEEKKLAQELKAQKLKEALTKKQPEEVDIAQIGLINELYEKLPKQVRKKNSAGEVVENQKKALKEAEDQFNIVKADYDKKKLWVETNQEAVLKANNELKQAKEDIKKLDKIKILSEKKAAANEKLNNANKDVERYQKELNEEKLKFKKINEEYEAMRGDEFLNNMTPEQYIHHLYIKAFENRKKMFEETEHKPLLDEMKEVRDAIDVIKGGREKVDEASNWKDRAWGLKYFRTRGKAMLKLDDQVAELEKSYAELQKQVEQHKKAFDEREKRYQERDAAHTPENLKMAKDFLDANRAKGEAQRKAGQDSLDRQKRLNDLIKNGKLAAKAAQNDIDEVNRDPLGGYQYNAEGHEHLKAQVPKISAHIHELVPKIKEMKHDLKEQELLVNNAAFAIDQKKLDIANSEKRYEEAKVTVSKSVGTIVHNASLLQKRGVEVPQPPADVLPHLPLLPLFQPQQPQAQPQAGPR